MLWTMLDITRASSTMTSDCHDSRRDEKEQLGVTCPGFVRHRTSLNAETKLKLTSFAGLQDLVLPFLAIRIVSLPLPPLLRISPALPKRNRHRVVAVAVVEVVVGLVGALAAVAVVVGVVVAMAVAVAE